MSDLEDHLVRRHSATNELLEAMVQDADEHKAHEILSRTHRSLHGHGGIDDPHDHQPDEDWA